MYIAYCIMYYITILNIIDLQYAILQYAVQRVILYYVIQDIVITYMYYVKLLKYATRGG